MSRGKPMDLDALIRMKSKRRARAKKLKKASDDLFKAAGDRGLKVVTGDTKVPGVKAPTVRGINEPMPTRQAEASRARIIGATERRGKMAWPVEAHRVKTGKPGGSERAKTETMYREIPRKLEEKPVFPKTFAQAAGSRTASSEAPKPETMSRHPIREFTFGAEQRAEPIIKFGSSGRSEPQSKWWKPSPSPPEHWNEGAQERRMLLGKACSELLKAVEAAEDVPNPSSVIPHTPKTTASTKPTVSAPTASPGVTATKGYWSKRT